MDFRWKKEAVDAAVSQWESSQFSNITHEEVIEEMLYAAANAQFSKCNNDCTESTQEKTHG